MRKSTWMLLKKAADWNESPKRDFLKSGFRAHGVGVTAWLVSHG